MINNDKYWQMKIQNHPKRNSCPLRCHKPWQLFFSSYLLLRYLSWYIHWQIMTNSDKNWQIKIQTHTKWNSCPSRRNETKADFLSVFFIFAALKFVMKQILRKKNAHHKKWNSCPYYGIEALQIGHYILTQIILDWNFCKKWTNWYDNRLPTDPDPIKMQNA